MQSATRLQCIVGDAEPSSTLLTGLRTPTQYLRWPFPEAIAFATIRKVGKQVFGHIRHALFYSASAKASPSGDVLVWSMFGGGSPLVHREGINGGPRMTSFMPMASLLRSLPSFRGSAIVLVLFSRVLVRSADSSASSTPFFTDRGHVQGTRRRGWSGDWHSS
ncbi:uncharacterized protein SCHCODRAFT_02067837 [Schizophyllum commune H4-8]|uniref:uncharacterized protein n=1 Tax=Schizophyllum commune (strain H4-8 / FGSC 9210) TaxID=578458 RepID=UPI00215ED5BD|nr:uncharacterized protein SCHCODRAFT_02067837 [Schizophyllum commune H4-8]KAI5887538.1 hypothetical protein SCHCODRAFT_02067837 [Schizophyllum commune H4-8]